VSAGALAGDLARAAVRVAAGLMVGALATTAAIGLVSLIFSGDLAAYRQQGIGLALFAAAALGVASAWGLSYRGAICHPQDATTVALAVAAAAIAARMGPGDGETLFATVFMLIALTSLTTAVALLATAHFRLGRIVRFVPHTVMGGFLTATGLLLVRGAAEMAAPWPWDEGSLDAQRTALALSAGAAIVALARWRGDDSIVPASFALLLALFYGWLGLSDTDLAEASQAGLLLGPFDDGFGLTTILDPDLTGRADYAQIWREAPTIALVALLAVIGATLNVSALSVETQTPLDLDRDLRAVAAGNALAALGGGLVGHHILGETLLARKITGVNTRWIGVGVAALGAAVLMFGAALLAALPVMVFAAAIAYIGFDFLYQWLWVERRRMPVEDFAVVALMLAVAGFVGFLEAVGVGVLTAAVIFAIGYARVDPVLRIASGSSYQSIVEGADGAGRSVAGPLDRTLVATLTGYLFFGVADRIHRRLRDAIAAQRDPPETLVLQMGRVAGVDASGAFALRRIESLAAAQGMRIMLVGARPSLLRRFAIMRLFDQAARHATFDDAILAIEEEADAPPPADAPRDDTPEDLLRPVALIADAWLEAPETVSAGGTIFHEGEPSDFLLILLEGRLQASRRTPGGDEVNIAVFLPGALVGEIGLLTGAARSASIVAARDSVVRRLTAERYAALSEADPALARDLNAYIARMLARRLSRASSRVGDLS